MITLYIWEILWRPNLSSQQNLDPQSKKGGGSAEQEDHLKDKLAIVQAQVYL